MAKKKRSKYLLGGLAIGLVLAVGFSVVAQVPGMLGIQNVENFFYSVPDEPEVEEVSLGVAAGPNLDSNYLRYNGIYEYYEQQGMKTGTSSPVCALRPIDRATTTIESFTAKITGEYAGALTYYLATSTSFYGPDSNATSTGTSLMLGHTVAASKEDYVAWAPHSNVSTSTAISPHLVISRAPDGSSNLILRPSEWLVWGFATTSVSSTSGGPTGDCSAIFRKI